MKPLPRFLPVVHVTSDEQAIEETQLALREGAQGVFLIDHKRPFHQLMNSYKWVRTRVGAEPWIGLNFLDMMADQAAGLMEYPGTARCDGLWVDYCGCMQPNMDVVGLSQLAKRLGAGAHWRFFAGTAFKYQKQPEDLFMATMRMAGFFDVVCTSGAATGSAPSLEKLVKMKVACGDAPLAVASGVSEENIHAMLPHVDCFMAATSICQSPDRFDPVKLRRLADIINSHKP